MTLYGYWLQETPEGNCEVFESADEFDHPEPIEVYDSVDAAIADLNLGHY